MKLLLVLYALHHPVPGHPAVYEWERTVIGPVDAEECLHIAGALQAAVPFDQKDLPRMECEAIK